MTKTNYICLTCNTQFTPKNKSKPNKFCGVACYRVYQKTPAFTTDYNRPKKNKTPVPCANCQADVVRNPSVKRDGTISDKVYCNRKCYNEHRVKWQNVVVGNCGNCNKEITQGMHKQYGNAYCSMSCRVEHKRPKPRACIVCSKVFDPLKYDKARDITVRCDSKKTCSDDCLREFYRTDQDRKDRISAAFKGDKHPNWQGGVTYSHTDFRGGNWQLLRGKVMARDGYKCQHCGISKDEQLKKYGRMFSINHIVPFHQLSGNTVAANKMSNLETLCDSCHTKADWAYRKENPIQGVLNFGR